MMRNPYKALEAIAKLADGDFGLELELLTYDIVGIFEKKTGSYIPLSRQRKEKDEKLKKAAQIITKIYCIAHAEVSPCRHPDWEEIKYEVLKS